MPEKSSYPHGTFSWIDLSAKDMKAAAAWYGALFGWTLELNTDEGMPYGMLMLNGKSVCGVGELTAEMVAAGVPPMWNSYVNVDDAEPIAAKVTELGGTVNVPVMKVGEVGSLAFFMDPVGASFAVWQPGLHCGSQLVNENNTWTWNEFQGRELDKASAFYTELFGWESMTMPMPNGTEYRMFKNQGDMNAGMVEVPAAAGDVPNYWAVYFQVGDIAATLAKVAETGGKVIAPAMEITQGTIATIADPQGAVFSLIQPKAE